VTTAAERVKELADAELYTASALQEYTSRVRNLCRDLAYILEFQAETLQATLATLPVVDSKLGPLTSRVRARTVAVCMRTAAEAVTHAGKLNVKAWALFVKYYVPEHKKPGAKTKKKFDINA
jgi:hypothetical protein